MPVSPQARQNLSGTGLEFVNLPKRQDVAMVSVVAVI
jgi:hypothetical protein